MAVDACGCMVCVFAVAVAVGAGVAVAVADAVVAVVWWYGCCGGGIGSLLTTGCSRFTSTAELSLQVCLLPKGVECRYYLRPSIVTICSANLRTPLFGPGDLKLRI